jgi:hypothetical protein
MNFNNAINENPEQNRQKRVQEAMTYHDPVEEKIRAFDARVAAAKEKEAATLPVPADGGDGTPPPAPAEPPIMQRMEGDNMYDIEKREDGFYALAKTPVGGETIQYPKPLFLGDTLPPDAQKEKGFLDTMMATEFPTPLDVAKGVGDAAQGAFQGYGAGLSKFLSNTARTIASSPLGEAFMKPEQIEQFETLIKDFNTQVDAVAGEGVDTLAGKIAGGAGEIGGQYVMPAVLGYRFFTGMGANPLTASLMADGVTALMGVAPEEKNLSNLIPEDSETFGALRELMATDPNDPDWMNRSRNAAEAMTLLLGGEGAIRGGAKAIQGVMEGVQKIAKFANETGIPQEFGAAFNKFMADESGALKIGSEQPNAPTFFSAVEQASQKLPAKMSGQQALATIANTPGVKQEEMQWIGLDDFLKSKPNVTKKEIQEFVTQNNVELKEKTLRNVVTQEDENILAELQDRAPQNITEVPATDGDARYGDYRTPGGTNYREMLVQLPRQMPELPKGYKTLYNAEKNTYEIFDANDQLKASGKDEAAAKNQLSRNSMSYDKGYANDVFKTPHFNEENILAHTRVSDHVTADGKKTLMVEEIQSDWHQQGRKKGYKGKYTEKGLEDWYNSIRRNNDFTFEELKKADNLDLAKTQYQNFLDGGLDAKVADAPFKKTWHELMFKRVLREAAEKGYDSLSWTTGATQADRFDLSKKVKQVRIDTASDGTLSLKAYDHGDNTVIRKVIKDEAELADHIGKEAAAKAIKQLDESKQSGSKFPKADLRGLDLKVGGKGMEGFYDKILPDYAKKYVKKWGATVEKSAIETGGGKPTQYADFDAWQKAKGGQQTEVWTVPITQAMRESVTKAGQPLFQAGGAVAGTAAVMNPDDADASMGSKILGPVIETVAKGHTLDRAIALLHDVAHPNAPIISEEIAVKMRAAVEQSGNAVEGIDFNLSRIENGEQLGALINEVSKVYEGPIGQAKRGVQTFDVTQTKADMTRTMGFDVDEILKRQPGELWPAHKIKAARDIFVQQVNTTTEMANQIKAGNNSSEALIAFRRQLAVNAAMQAQIKGVQTEAARALSQFRMTAKSPLEGKVQIEELLQISGRRGSQ